VPFVTARTTATRHARERTTVLVLGGSDGLGAWTIDHIWRDLLGVRVDIADIAAPSSIADGVGFHHLSYDDGGVTGLPDLGRYDVVVVAVPIPAIAQVADLILPQVTPGTLVLDIASVKEQPMEIVEATLAPGVSYIGTHPLFGAAVPSLVGQTVVVCQTACSAPSDVTWLCDLLTARGATTREMTAAEHDSAMAIVQVLTHFTTLTVAFTLEHAGADFRHALDLLTPPFRTLAGLTGRIMDIPPAPPDGKGARLFADIQVAEYADAQRIRDGFEQAARQINELARTGDPAALAQEIERVAGFYPSDDLAMCKQLFAQSHASAQAEAVRLHEHRTTGALCAFRSVGRSRVIAGRVVEFSSTAVTLEVCSARAGDNDTRDKRRLKQKKAGDRRKANTSGGGGTTDELTGKYGFAFDERSRAAAAKIGFNIPRDRTETLPRGDYRLMSAAELEQWKVEEVLRYRRDVTLVIPPAVDVDALLRLIPRIVAPVLAVHHVGAPYTPKGSKHRRCTFGLEIRGDVLPDAVVGELLDDLAGFSITTPLMEVA
jgi:prephenate dehydrogenase